MYTKGIFHKWTRKKIKKVKDLNSPVTELQTQTANEHMKRNSPIVRETIMRHLYTDQTRIH